MCQEGVFVVENISFYNDAKLVTELTADADWKRRGLYIGPQVCLSRFVMVESGF
jgi:complement component 1 Q subcomponent-binding protein, mitochondrial